MSLHITSTPGNSRCSSLAMALPFSKRRFSCGWPSEITTSGFRCAAGVMVTPLLPYATARISRHGHGVHMCAHVEYMRLMLPRGSAETCTSSAVLPRPARTLRNRT